MSTRRGARDLQDQTTNPKKNAMDRIQQTIAPTNPKGIAEFCLGLGYDEASVVNALVERCNIDRAAAVRIVAQTQRQEGSR